MTEEQKQKKKAYRLKYRQTHKDEIAAYNRKYYLAHKDKVHAYKKKWQEENRDKVRSYCNKYAAKHREEARAATAEWRVAHSDYNNIYQNLYRQKKKAVKRGDSVTEMACSLALRMVSSAFKSIAK